MLFALFLVLEEKLWREAGCTEFLGFSQRCFILLAKLRSRDYPIMMLLERS